MTSIELRNLTVAGNGVRPLLDDVSLTVPAGSTLAITGPAGSGKSLLLRVLVGLEDPTSGDILIDDAVVTYASPRTRDLAMVFQDYELHPQLDVFDNLAFSATLRRGFDKAAVAKRVQDVAESLAIAGLLESMPSVLDDSQRQRVALGRSLVRDASAYLFDEAFSAQSARSATQVRSVTSQWQHQNERT
jgi:multiple sugar transport system ATP-binding protein